MQRRRVQPLAALRTVRRLVNEPERTELVFEVIEQLAGRNFERTFERVLADPVGRSILEERRSLLAVLSNRETLRSLPAGTLGREYARFMDTEDISADGLEQASQIEKIQIYDDRARCLSERLRDMHDLWHVVTGYGRDYIGENALLAFSYSQTRNRGIGFIAWYGMREWKKGGHDDVVSLIRDAYRRGREAAFLPACDWEALLERPLDEVRRELCIDEPPQYEPLDV